MAASLAQTILSGLQSQLSMAYAADNQDRIAKLNADIKKLKEQIAEADKNGHGRVQGYPAEIIR